MRVFLYEYITGGGLLADVKPPSGSLLAEGRAMVLALTKDLSSVGGVEVVIIRDARLKLDVPPACRVFDVADLQDEQDTFAGLAAECDATIVIAPEFDGILLTRAEAVLAAGGALLSCPPETIRIAADKQRTAELLEAAGVPVPAGRLVQPGEEFLFDDAQGMVLKPNDGVGSMRVRRIESPESVPGDLREVPWRLEEYCAGEPVSCSVICGPQVRATLPCCTQRIESGEFFGYSGGWVKSDSVESHRACVLAERAVSALPEPRGYVGVDMVLGEAADGSDDVVIEVNPRLTTSYVGVREVVKQNLAGAMIDIARGKDVSISWYNAQVSFRADGTIFGREDEMILGVRP